jgi:ESCRT-II complex subunit VPS36
LHWTKYGVHGIVSEESVGVLFLYPYWSGLTLAIALIPPSTFSQVLPLLPQYTSPPILTRSFHSNLKVVHTPWYSQRSFSQRLLTYLDAVGPKSTVQVAEQEGISVGLVAEMIGAAERDGKVVKDVEGDAKEVKWWRNYFDGYIWDGD